MNIGTLANAGSMHPQCFPASRAMNEDVSYTDASMSVKRLIRRVGFRVVARRGGRCSA